MRYEFTIYSTEKHLFLKIGHQHPHIWYTTTAIVDRDYQERMFGIELFLYLEEKLTSIWDKIEQQFQDFDNINIDEHGMMYISIRDEKLIRPGPGFGRSVRLGIDQVGLLSMVQIPWDEVGAATPIATPSHALAGLLYQQGSPQME
ncbi:MAG: hypothetical protein H0X37_27055 [Herpetosiphonaceae bacterium]|nr:hypothetical protein [Herpetosiphonaceae bacterium]